MKKVFASISLLGLAACSSIVEGTTQQITINTNPAGADCTLKRQEEVLGHINPTPGSLLVKKTKYDINIVCTKAGYQDTTYLNHSGTAGATWGNIIAGGGIGWAVDSAAGADNKYESPLNITLAPESSKNSKK